MTLNLSWTDTQSRLSEMTKVFWYFHQNQTSTIYQLKWKTKSREWALSKSKLVHPNELVPTQSGAKYQILKYQYKNLVQNAKPKFKNKNLGIIHK